MFSTLTVEAHTWLIGLFVIWAALLFGGLLTAHRAHSKGVARTTRLLSSLTLVIAGWSLAWFTMDTLWAVFARRIAVGMTFGFIGDLFMAEALPAPRREIAGMAAFGLGHLAYIAAGVSISRSTGLTAPVPLAAAWIVGLLLGVLGWYAALIRRANRITPFHLVALGYALLLASTLGIASGLALQDRTFLPFALGAALFFFSDLLLAADVFGGHHFSLTDDLIWLTYGPGQTLIVLGASFLR